MAEAAKTYSVVINAPVECTWPLLIKQQPASEHKYLHFEPEGPPIAGQIISSKLGRLRMTISIDSVIQAEPPLVGQTIYAKISFLGLHGEAETRWMCNNEHHHLQSQAIYRHPWLDFNNHIDIRCATLDSNLCIVVYSEQSNMSFRFFPRWLNRQLNQSEAEENMTAKAIEKFLQGIKAKAELS